MLTAFIFASEACTKKDDKDNKNTIENKDKEVEKDKDKEKDKSFIEDDEDKAQGLAGWEIIFQKQVGKITNKTSYKDLEAEFGAKSLQKDEFCIEGDCQPATKIVEAGKDMVSVVWTDNTKKKINFIQILSPRIKLPDGTHIGTTLKTLVRKNDNKPITFSGFDWGMSGNVIDYNKGKLDKSSKDYSLGLGYDREDMKIKMPPALMGDVKVMSNNPILSKIPIKVDRIQVFFANDRK